MVRQFGAGGRSAPGGEGNPVSFQMIGCGLAAVNPERRDRGAGRPGTGENHHIGQRVYDNARE
jgi:hypothetical protein